MHLRYLPSYKPDHPHILLLKIVSSQSLRQILSGHFHSGLFFYNLRKFLYGHAFSAQYYLDLFSKCKIFHALPPSRIFTSDRKYFYFPSPNFSHCSKSHFMRQSQRLFFRYRKKRVSIPACEIKTLPVYFCICARYSSSVIPFFMIAFAASSPT